MSEPVAGGGVGGVTCVLLHNTENGARALQEPWLQEDRECPQVAPGPTALQHSV